MPIAESARIATGAGALERNLGVLCRGSPDAAARVRLAAARGDAAFINTADGVPALELRAPDGAAVALCSRRRPLEEARRIIEQVDPAEAAIFVVPGFGAGYHVAELARKIGRSGLIVVFEPDVPLLRAVLERTDHSAWMSECNVTFLTDPDDAGAMAAAVQGLEALVTLGVKIVPHPASEARLASVRERFDATFSRLVEALTLTARTSIFQSKVTLRNLMQNAERYVLGGGAARFRGAFAGRPAVFVAAGPSLERNIELLAAPGVRERVVIVAAQTVLRSLLARGVKPHFVTALDYSELSLRFYEGLRAADVEGVTLIVEPKVNRAVTDAFPGSVVCVDDKHLDLLLGPDLTSHRGEGGGMVPCATVAHLAYHWARFLGCDPVGAIGQDLGFTDGMYYSSGAAIHDVWAPELNEFNTLEMLEWQRVKRMGSQLMPAADAQGRPIYTDRQMNNYRVQFERDFRADADRGLRTFDCTEGGVAKGHAPPMTLRAFLDSFAPIGAGAPPRQAGASAPDRADRALHEGEPPHPSRIRDRFRSLRKDVWRIGEASRRAAVLLSEMAEHHADQARVNRLIRQVYALRDEVTALEPAFTLVQLLDQKGGVNRVRADRAINLDAALPPLERQRRQIERDAENVRSLAVAADELGYLLDCEIRAQGGAKRDTRDADLVRVDGAAVGVAWVEASARVRCAAVVPIGPEDMPHARAGLLPGTSVLRATVSRLARCTRIDRIVLLAADAESARAALGGEAVGKPVDVVPVAGRIGAPGFVRAGRLGAGACWRGGLGGATVFDEALDAANTARVLDELKFDAALLVGAAWCMVDPAICDAVIERHTQNPEQYRYVFSTAAPGLGACVVSRTMMSELARLSAQAGVLGTLGAVLGYLPVAPMADPIGSRACVPAAPAVRNAGERFIADSRSALARLSAVAARLGPHWMESDSAAVVEALHAALADAPLRTGPGAVEMLVGPVAANTRQWRARIVSEIGALRDDATLTIAGALRSARSPAREEVLLDPALPALVRAARAAALRCVHVRTGLRAGPDAIDALLSADPHVLSVDLLAESPGVYGAAAGEDALALAWTGLEHVLRRRGTWPLGDAAPGAWRGWVVPRMTKCDAAYAEMERFYDRWIMMCGWAVIDGPPTRAEGARIAPLAVPRSKAQRDARSTMTIDPAGQVHGPRGEVVGDLSRDAVGDVWARLWNARRGAELI
ncbi:MAG: motility associated factor glycosyltransferase family protein [Phycisphaeraceae bacterium]|nr:motility associated factor glycosyltransferase family protein [Phycisphaeraceae bacterium]